MSSPELSQLILFVWFGTQLCFHALNRIYNFLYPVPLVAGFFFSLTVYGTFLIIFIQADQLGVIHPQKHWIWGF